MRGPETLTENPESWASPCCPAELGTFGRMWPQIPAWKLPQVIWLHTAVGNCCGLSADLHLNPKVSVDTLGLSITQA